MHALSRVFLAFGGIKSSKDEFDDTWAYDV